jgi:hypothetical protein
VTVKTADSDVQGLVALRASLQSWDVEFRIIEPRYTPALQLEVVDSDTFNHFDTKAAYGVDESETNHAMLMSELDWLDSQLEETFKRNFVKETDYVIPYK